MRVWLSTFARARETHLVAQCAESAGFAGILLTDSPCLVPDPFVELAAVADSTTHLQMGTCASNAVVRHPSVLASAAMTLQERSHGRMSLGVARGDSGVTKVGLHPQSPEEFGHTLADLRALVRGEAVSFGGTMASLTWMDPATPPTPIVGVASGPRAIAAAASNADGVMIQVGSDPEAVSRCVDLARNAQSSNDLTITVYVIVGLPGEGATASPIDGVTPLLARMAAATLTQAKSSQAQAATTAASNYSLETHGLAAAGAGHPEIENYAVVGDIEHCRSRLGELADTGCDELAVILGSVTTPTDELLDLIQEFGAQVLPTLHRPA